MKKIHTENKIILFILNPTNRFVVSDSSAVVNLSCVSTEQHEGEQIDYQGICWQRVTDTLTCTEPLGQNRKSTYTECCCLYGEAWGMDCALCPSKHTGTRCTKKNKTHTQNPNVDLSKQGKKLLLLFKEIFNCTYRK